MRWIAVFVGEYKWMVQLSTKGTPCCVHSAMQPPGIEQHPAEMDFWRLPGMDMGSMLEVSARVIADEGWKCRFKESNGCRVPIPGGLEQSNT